MSSKDDAEFDEKYPSVNTVSPYENVRLQYKSNNEPEVSNSQLRLACLEASVAFHDDKVVEDPTTIIDTAQQFWQFVNNIGQ